MREAASRGFFMTSQAPYGYRRVKVTDGKKERTRLEPDPARRSTVTRMFELAQQGAGLKDIARTLNRDGIAGANGIPWTRLLSIGSSKMRHIRALWCGDAFHKATAVNPLFESMGPGSLWYRSERSRSSNSCSVTGRFPNHTRAAPVAAIC